MRMIIDMNHFVGMAHNEYYTIDKDGKQELVVEMVLLFDRPDYQLTNDGQIIRNRKVEEARFVVSKRNLDTMIASLTRTSEGLPLVDNE